MAPGTVHFTQHTKDECLSGWMDDIGALCPACVAGQAMVHGGHRRSMQSLNGSRFTERPHADMLCTSEGAGAGLLGGGTIGCSRWGVISVHHRWLSCSPQQWETESPSGRLCGLK
jgi:hypothetical protein